MTPPARRFRSLVRTARNDPHSVNNGDLFVLMVALMVLRAHHDIASLGKAPQIVFRVLSKLLHAETSFSPMDTAGQYVVDKHVKHYDSRHTGR
jgi:hypothetical protein